MLNDITIVKCEVMSHLVRLRGKDTVQCAHCAVVELALVGSSLLLLPPSQLNPSLLHTGVSFLAGHPGKTRTRTGVTCLAAWHRL